MTTPRTSFHVGHAVENALRKAALTYGAGKAELAALDRLVECRGELVDVARLDLLAAKAGLPWSELFPEIDTMWAVQMDPVRGQLAPLNQLCNAVQRWRSFPLVEGSHTGSYLAGILAGTVVRCAEAALDAGLPVDVVRHIVKSREVAAS